MIYLHTDFSIHPLISCVLCCYWGDFFFIFADSRDNYANGLDFGKFADDCSFKLINYLFMN